MGIGVFSWVAYAVWAISEIFMIVRSRRMRGDVETENADKGSVVFLGVTIFASIMIAILFHLLGWGSVATLATIIGAILMLAGVALRFWAFTTLGRNFTQTVVTDAQQELIQSGPYKLIRHPSYTGALITLVFLGLAFGSWIASCVILVIVASIYVYRIQVEERALQAHFGAAFDEYRKRTKRLIPFVW